MLEKVHFSSVNVKLLGETVHERPTEKGITFSLRLLPNQKPVKVQSKSQADLCVREISKCLIKIIPSANAAQLSNLFVCSYCLGPLDLMVQNQTTKLCFWDECFLLVTLLNQLKYTSFSSFCFVFRSFYALHTF